MLGGGTTLTGGGYMFRSLFFLSVSLCATAQVQTIYIPYGSGSGSSFSEVKILGALTVVGPDGATRVLTGAALGGANTSLLNLSGDDVASVVVLTVGGNDYRSRQNLVVDKEDFYWIVLPLSMMDRMAVKGKELTDPELGGHAQRRRAGPPSATESRCPGIRLSGHWQRGSQGVWQG